ncbi:MAG: LysE family transporter [Bacteroidetes bacterium]|nr:LysE family transporter [Bacteroidota bacterium]MBL6943617.1 LysE family transporter [Bacteroidales bacterium]
MSVFIEGTILGFSLAFLFGFGPAFFALIQTGIYRGFIPGLFLAFGIFLNDLLIVTVSLLGATTIMSNTENFSLIGIIGGALLVIFGIVTYLRKTEIEDSEDRSEIKVPHPLIYIGKGFLLNAVNPFVWIFWVSIIVSITARFSADTSKLILFFSGTLSVVLLTDIIKTFAAYQFKKFATDKFLILINKIAGIAITLFGIFLIMRSLFWL